MSGNRLLTIAEMRQGVVGAVNQNGRDLSPKDRKLLLRLALQWLGLSPK